MGGRGNSYNFPYHSSEFFFPFLFRILIKFPPRKRERERKQCPVIHNVIQCEETFNEQFHLCRLTTLKTYMYWVVHTLNLWRYCEGLTRQMPSMIKTWSVISSLRLGARFARDQSRLLSTQQLAFPRKTYTISELDGVGRKDLNLQYRATTYPFFKKPSRCVSLCASLRTVGI